MAKKKIALARNGIPRINRIKEVLAEKKWTQQDLANAAQMGFASVNMYVNGKREPSLDTLVKIARALEVSPRELIIDFTP